MAFEAIDPDAVLVSMEDAANPLAAFSQHAFRLDDATWPSVAHYYEAMKFTDADVREQVRGSDHPKTAQALGGRYKRRVRKDWDKVKEVYMRRGVYLKCRTHEDASSALLATGERAIIETSQYDYYWGCGRDTRGLNTYGKVLMAVRAKLREEAGR